MTKPIKPGDLSDSPNIPDEVIEVFNELIRGKWDGSKAIIKRDDAIKAIQKCWTQLHKTSISRDKIFKKHYLDVEELYRKQGWSVEYDQPSWGEDYEPFYTFTKRR